jgi:raffinose/stachyose/melibiose transport system permease protein
MLLTMRDDARGARRALARISLMILLALLLVGMLLPLAMIGVNALKTEDDYRRNGPLALPESLDLSALRHASQSMEYPLKLKNSLVISAAAAALGTALSLCNAYALAIGQVRGRWLFLAAFLLGLVLPREALVFPLYHAFRAVGLYDRSAPLILVFAALHSTFGACLLSWALSRFPPDLLDAADLDGCTRLQTLTRVVAPAMLPVLAALFAFFFLWTWNDFFVSLIFLYSNARQTVPLAVVRADQGTTMTLLSAVAALGIAPAVVFAFLFQRTLTRARMMEEEK